MFAARYEHWLAVVDLLLRGHTGRGVADLPAEITDAMLRCWWRAGVPARVVAQGLSTKVVRVRVTFVEQFGDRPVDKFMQMRSVS